MLGLIVKSIVKKISFFCFIENWSQTRHYHGNIGSQSDIISSQFFISN